MKVHNAITASTGTNGGFQQLTLRYRAYRQIVGASHRPQQAKPMIIQGYRDTTFTPTAYLYQS